jgi:hypothetical protein
MVKLTPELIEDSFQYMNPVKEYELNLRGTCVRVHVFDLNNHF